MREFYLRIEVNSKEELRDIFDIKNTLAEHPHVVSVERVTKVMPNQTFDIEFTPKAIDTWRIIHGRSSEIPQFTFLPSEYEHPNAKQSIVFDIQGIPILMHHSKKCDTKTKAFVYCPLHQPSGHPLNTWPLEYRKLVIGDPFSTMLRYCRHGMPHPDPDDLQFRLDRYPHRQISEHSNIECDGCCKFSPVLSYPV